MRSSAIWLPLCSSNLCRHMFCVSWATEWMQKHRAYVLGITAALFDGVLCECLLRATHVKMYRLRVLWPLRFGSVKYWLSALICRCVCVCFSFYPQQMNHEENLVLFKAATFVSISTNHRGINWPSKRLLHSHLYYSHPETEVGLTLSQITVSPVHLDSLSTSS